MMMAMLQPFGARTRLTASAAATPTTTPATRWKARESESYTVGWTIRSTASGAKYGRLCGSAARAATQARPAAIAVFAAKSTWSRVTCPGRAMPSCDDTNEGSHLLIAQACQDPARPPSVRLQLPLSHCYLSAQAGAHARRYMITRGIPSGLGVADGVGNQVLFAGVVITSRHRTRLNEAVVLRLLAAGAAATGKPRSRQAQQEQNLRFCMPRTPAIPISQARQIGRDVARWPRPGDCDAVLQPIRIVSDLIA